MDQSTNIEQLCPNCGLCCDSTLFADVELRASDKPARLSQLGLRLLKKTKTTTAFSQPCAGFDGKLCRIYADRPKRCQLFECGLLKRVEAGEMTPAAALKKITATKKRADAVRELLSRLGQREAQMALTHRYAKAMGEPMDLSQPEDSELRGELMLAVNDLMNILHRDFLR
jgi:Fe-S-cluster containining protein